MYRLIIALPLTILATLSTAAIPDSSADTKTSSPVKLVDRRGVKVDYGRIILLRYKTEAIALKLIGTSDTADDDRRSRDRRYAAFYKVWVNHRGPKRFHEGRLTKINGEVFEEFDGSHLNGSNSDTYLRCGSFKLGWSHGGPDSGYVYFLSLIHIPSPRDQRGSRMPSSA